METVLDGKKELRRRMLGVRRGMGEGARVSGSAKIWQRIRKERFFREARCVFCYVAMEDEVQTREALSFMLGQGKVVCVPYIVAKGVMEARRLSAMHGLATGRFGILTAMDGETVCPADIDCAIVPGIAFSRQGARLGMGGGYYDRFLGKAVRAFRVAAAFRCQLADDIPMAGHDCWMDAVATEEEMIFCGEGPSMAGELP